MKSLLKTMIITMSLFWPWFSNAQDTLSLRNGSHENAKATDAVGKPKIDSIGSKNNQKEHFVLKKTPLFMSNTIGSGKLNFYNGKSFQLLRPVNNRSLIFSKGQYPQPDIRWRALANDENLLNTPFGQLATEILGYGLMFLTP